MVGWLRAWASYLAVAWYHGAGFAFICFIALAGAGMFIGVPVAMLMKLVSPSQQFWGLWEASALLWAPAAVGAVLSFGPIGKQTEAPPSWRGWKHDRAIAAIRGEQP